LTLKSPVPRSLNVTYATQSGTAVGGDFAPVSGTLVFAAGEVSKTVTVMVLGDTVPEADETFSVNIQSPQETVTKPNGAGTIRNDDAGFLSTSIELSKGTKRFLTLRVPRTASAFNIPLASSVPSSVTVPDHVTVDAGAELANFEVSGVAHGTAIVQATLPASLGGKIVTTIVNVTEKPAIVFGTQPLMLVLGTAATETITIKPQQNREIPISLQVDDPTIAAVPQVVSIPPYGTVNVQINPLHAGKATITATFSGASSPETLPITVVDTLPPDIVGISPNVGSTTGGSPVTIVGNTFKPDCTISFGNAAAGNVTFVDEHTMAAKTPAHALGAVDVTVTCGATNDVLPGGFTFAPPRRRTTR
jgi:hypothetical protein